MITSVKSSSQISLEEFLRLPETKPASEYINGRVYQKPMAGMRHSMIQGHLPSKIDSPLAFGFIELTCTFGGSCLVPDIAIVERSRVPRDDDGSIANNFEIAPDWIIEIVSPEDSGGRLIDKIIFCLNNGTQLGWLVDPEDESIVTFLPKQQPEVWYNSEPLPMLNIVTDLQLSAKEIFSWLYM